MYLLTTTDQTDLIGCKHREMWVGHQSTIDKNSIWLRAISVRLYQIYSQNIIFLGDNKNRYILRTIHQVMSNFVT